jgi:uncharacterized damage-inducible protein DinB
MDYSLELATPILRQTPLVLEAMLAQLPDDWTHESEGFGSWTPLEVLGHMTYIEENDWMHRTRIILEHGTNRIFDPVDREKGFERFTGIGVGELLERFSIARTSNLRSLDSLVDTDSLDRQGLHPDFGEVRLDQLLATWVVHDLNHLGQIVKTMAKQYTDAVGPWREYLPIIDAE